MICDYFALYGPWAIKILITNYNILLPCVLINRFNRISSHPPNAIDIVLKTKGVTGGLSLFFVPHLQPEPRSRVFFSGRHLRKGFHPRPAVGFFSRVCSTRTPGRICRCHQEKVCQTLENKLTYPECHRCRPEKNTRDRTLAILLRQTDKDYPSKHTNHHIMVYFGPPPPSGGTHSIFP
jgi:hypothetical protein